MLIHDKSTKPNQAYAKCPYKDICKLKIVTEGVKKETQLCTHCNKTFITYYN